MMKRKSAASKKRPARSPDTKPASLKSKQGAARPVAKELVPLSADGLVAKAVGGLWEQIRSRRGYELHVYSTVEEALAHGFDRKLVRLAFAKAKGDCDGTCSKHDNGSDKPPTPATHVWCSDGGNCLGHGNCDCHLLENYQDPADGNKWKQRDLGTGFNKDNKYKKVAGCSYVCYCTT